MTPAERAARYREKKAARENPDAIKEKKEREEREEAERIAAKAALEEQKQKEKERREEKIKNMEGELTLAVAGTVSVLAEGIRSVAFANGGVPLGEDRAKELGNIWSKILAPKVVDAGIEGIATFMAIAQTAGIVMSWVDESRNNREDNEVNE